MNSPRAITYGPDLGVFLRTFNIRHEWDGLTFEAPMKAASWAQAEHILHAIKATYTVHNELIETTT